MTVLLLGLLVLVVVSLATITGVETGIAGNTRRFSEARQNALMALNIAIAELQEAAGPDQQITAAAAIRSDLVPVANLHWTGVWNSDDGTFVRWLASGEQAGPRPLNVLGDAEIVLNSGNSIELVGPNSSGTDVDNYVRALIQEIKAPYPGLPGNPTVGHYAWWVGDEGVKASLGLPDRLDDVDYGPYASPDGDENWRRLRQQVPLGPEHFGAVGTPFGFDPASSNNSTAISNVLTREQLRFLNPVSALGPYTTFLRNGFHSFTPAAFGVLASTNPDFPGLKRDLSVDPSVLGSGFAAWAGREDMEAPAPGNTAVPPIDSTDDYRRRYYITPPSPSSPSTGDIVYSIAPILTDFVIQFGVAPSAGGGVDVYTRLCVGLWNPYTSALFPEDLRLEITGLPTMTVEKGPPGPDTLLVSLQDTLAGSGNPFIVSLPFSSGSAPGSLEDRNSWLPGRAYNWKTGTLDTSPPAIPSMEFYAKVFGNSEGLRYTAAGSLTVAPTWLVSGPDSTEITVRLTQSDGTHLGTYTGPSMSRWGPIETTETDPATPGFWIFGFGLRLIQPNTGDSSDDGWLGAGSIDPRGTNIIGLNAYDPINGIDPTAYLGDIETDWNSVDAFPGYLLNRSTVVPSGESSLWVTTYNNDTPLFELPRASVLSLGALQHLQIADQRPFSVGNSWGADVSVPVGVGSETIGSWWDRYFFSGLDAMAELEDSTSPPAFPWFHLRPVDSRASPSSPFDLGVVRSAAAYSSEYLLMGGAFNVNSSSVSAWEAVLKSMRPFVDQGNSALPFVNLDATTGGLQSEDLIALEDLTQGVTGSLAARGVGYFRFPQSAQETFETDTGNTGSEAPSGFNRSRYRQGLRAGNETFTEGEQQGRYLTSEDISSLAAEIVEDILERGVPFTSMEEFLSPFAGGRSVLEDAIWEAGLNSEIRWGIDFDGDGIQPGDEMEMCSVKLTQADILTAIGPMLQTRSDTFLVRAYGESLNPLTGEVEGRAWCEAKVQRVPTPVNPSDDIVNPPGTLGRRFEIISFRWLTPADI